MCVCVCVKLDSTVNSYIHSFSYNLKHMYAYIIKKIKCGCVRFSIQNFEILKFNFDKSS